jgi:DNA-binding beta-propeller fold protein YncE
MKDVMQSHLGQQRALRMAAWLFVACIMASVMACSGGGQHATNGGDADGRSAVDGTPATAKKSWAGKDPAPAIPGGLTWFNVAKPLTLQELKGKVVLLDFWTLGCINCQQIIPDLHRLETEFGDALVVIGVHSGKYSTEHDDASIRDAIKRYNLDHPVVNDPDFAVWNTFGANAWPTLVLIDPAGNLVGGHAGEGVYDLFQPIVSSLVQEFDAKKQVDRTPIPLSLEGATTTSTVLSYPGKVLADAAGKRLFIADSTHNRILVSDLDGRLTQAIGSGKEGFEDGGPSDSSFRQPQGLALSPDGKTLYVADTRNHAVRSVDLASGEVTTIAGTGKQLEKMPTGNAKATETAMSSPWDVVRVGKTLFITMAGIHQLWALDLDKGTISVFAGTSREGIDDGPRTQATLAQPSGITTDGKYLYWVDPESSSVRQVPVSGDGEVESITGTGLFDYGDKDGNGKSAKLQHPQGITLAGTVLYVSDTYNHQVRTVDTVSHAVGTAAGAGPDGRGWNDGTGAAAQFDEPGGLGYADGKVYVADTNNNLIRVLDTKTNSVSTLTLSNLSVASDRAPGRKLQAQLPAQEVSNTASGLRVTFTAPAGYHLNSQAPSTLTLTSSNAAVVDLGEKTLNWSTDDGQVSLPVPASLHDGSATITGQASVYYCRTGSEALCFIQQIEITAPVTVSAGAASGEIKFDYTLPESSS